MAEVIDLHKHLRPATGAIFAQIGREIVEVMEISVAGIRVARPSSWSPCRNIRFKIVPQTGTVLDFAHAVPINGHVVGHGPDHLRIAFASVSHPLARIIQAHVAVADDSLCLAAIPDCVRPA